MVIMIMGCTAKVVESCADTLTHIQRHILQHIAQPCFSANALELLDALDCTIRCIIISPETYTAKTPDTAGPALHQSGGPVGKHDVCKSWSGTCLHRSPTMSNWHAHTCITSDSIAFSYPSVRLRMTHNAAVRTSTPSWWRCAFMH